MKISIVIPTYNRAHLIGETLQSVIDQAYINWECIVVDDGSTDDTAKVVEMFIKKDARVSFCERPSDRKKGANACRNYGFSQSTGDLINWLDSDDLLKSDHFGTHVALHTTHPKIAMAISNASLFYNNPKEASGKWSNIQPVSSEPYRDMIAGKISWSTPSVVWKKDSLPTLPWNEDLWSSQEWTFHVFQLIRKLRFKISDKVTINVRRHEERVGRSINPKKLKSGFLSRFLVYRELQCNNLLNAKDRYDLLKIMVKNIKMAVRNKYDSAIWFQSFCLFKTIGFHPYSFAIIKILLISIPIFRLFGSGERLFAFIEKNN